MTPRSSDCAFYVAGNLILTGDLAGVVRAFGPGYFGIAPHATMSLP
jgi:hypothetical protein